MREMKFRAWNPRLKRMSYNFEEINITGDDIVGDFDGGKIKAKYMKESGIWVDAPLMQYTGLQDRNGKDIYEGDMIFHYDQNCIIEYDSSAFVLKGLHKDKYKRAYAHLAHYLIDVTIPEVDGSKYDGVTTKLEVIGNRFDNPELLGEVRE